MDNNVYIFPLDETSKCLKALSTRIRIFLSPHLFPTGYGFLPHVYIGESGIRINPQIFESALQSGKGESGFLIRKEKVADSNISGYVLTEPKMREITIV